MEKREILYILITQAEMLAEEAPKNDFFAGYVMGLKTARDELGLFKDFNSWLREGIDIESKAPF